MKERERLKEAEISFHYIEYGIVGTRDGHRPISGLKSRGILSSLGLSSKDSWTAPPPNNCLASVNSGLSIPAPHAYATSGLGRYHHNTPASPGSWHEYFPDVVPSLPANLVVLGMMFDATWKWHEYIGGVMYLHHFPVGSRMLGGSIRWSIPVQFMPGFLLPQTELVFPG